MCNKEIIENELNKRAVSLTGAEKGKVRTGSLPSGEKDNDEILQRRAGHKEAIAKITRELAKKYPEPASRQWNEKKPGYPMNYEKALLTALRKGEPDEAKKQLNKLLATIIFSSMGNFETIQLHVIELTVLLSRIEITPGNFDIFEKETNIQSLKMALEAEH